MKLLLVDDINAIPTISLVLREIAKHFGVAVEIVSTDNCVEARKLLRDTDVTVIDLFDEDRQMVAALANNMAKPIIALHSVIGGSLPKDSETLRFVCLIGWDIQVIGKALKDFQRILSERVFYQDPKNTIVV